MRKRRRGFCRNQLGQSGQGVIEYILLLVVIVGIILGLFYQFNDAFRNYTQRYMGEYLACLIETGELPALSSDEDNATDCVAPDFDAAAATAGSESGSGGRSGGGANGAGDGGSSDRDGSGSENDSDSERSQAQGESRPNGGEGNRGGRSSTGTGPSRRGGGGGAAAAALPAGPQEQAYTGSTETSSRNMGSYSNALSDRQNKERRFLDGSFDTSSPREEKKKERVVAIKNDAGGGGPPLRQKMIEVKASDRKPAESKTEEDDFSFGVLFRWLLIFLIIVSLLLFLGGQALQISKSWEK